MQAATAADIASRIEALWGQPIAELQQEAEVHPGATMLAALLRLRSDTDLAERHIAALRDRIHQLTHPDRAIREFTFTARHLLDAAQRLSVAVTARDAHLAAATAVLDGLRRRDTPSAEAPPAAAALPATPAPAAHTLPAR